MVCFSNYYYLIKMDINHQNLFFLFLFIIGFSYIQSTPIDPCDLRNSFMYCECNIYDNPEESDMIVCNAFMKSTITDPVWLSIQKLSSAVTFKLQMRNERLIDYFIPIQIFSKMKKLQYFYTKGGNIVSIPSFAFANSSSIDQIVLDNNNISKLEPYAFANMNNLTVLTLAENAIEEIGRNVFVNLPNLKQIDLKRNQLTVIHDRAFQSLFTLEELQLQKNNLTILTRDVFFGLDSLRILDLSENMIELLGENVFSELNKVYDIDLTGNNIAFVSPTAFSGLASVGRLNLRNNKLIQMTAATFEPLHNLHFLDLRFNLLEELDIGPLIDNFEGTGQLMIEENKFKCQCHIVWMHTLYNKTKVEIIQNHLKLVECEIPQKSARHLITNTATESTLNSGFQYGSPPNLTTTMIGNPPEQTTIYTVASVKKKVLNLKFTDDLNCHAAASATSSRKNRISSTTGTANPSALEYERHSENQSDEGSINVAKQIPNNKDTNGKAFHHHHQVADQTSSSSSAPKYNIFSVIISLSSSMMTFCCFFCLLLMSL